MKYIAKTLYGLEQVLAGELTGLGAKDVIAVNRAVLFTGDTGLMYKVNYCSRTALSVLEQIADFRIRTADELYQRSSRIEWDKYLDRDQTFSIVPVVNSPLFTHTGYPALVLKDVIADWFRKKTGYRPSVETQDPDVVFNLHISNTQVTISVDSSVVPLFKRGYRTDQGPAPLNEVLAAGIIMLSGWDGKADLTDPMCGSGTIPVEAAMIAGNIPPGRFRSFFGFQRWQNFNNDLFGTVKAECDALETIPVARISGSDISEEAVIQAKKNAENAGLSGVVSIQTLDFRELKSSSEDGFIIMNPPYGQRLRPDDLDALYSMIGSTLKHSFAGNRALLLTSDKELLKFIGLKPKEKRTLFNGSLECILVKYELYQGTRKTIKE